MKDLYAYIRVSTPKQGERGSSLQEQRAAIETYAGRHGLTIARWFEEQETAAKRGRRVFNEMLRLLEAQRAAGVIIHKIDRSARNLRDWADLGELIDRGIDVHFAHESLDLNSRGGRLSADIQAVVAADYIRNLRQEVRKGFVGRLKQGLYPLPAPIGYLDQGRGLPKVPDPMTAPLVRRAFELYATGQYNLRTLKTEMYRLGLRNRRGGRVSRTGLSVMLRNTFYIGLVTIKRTRETFQGVHDALIVKSLFDRVQHVLSGRIQHTGLKYDFLYRKTLQCVRCGYRLIAERQKGHVYYRCHTRDCAGVCLREEEIDAQVATAIGKLTFTPDELQLLTEEFRQLQAKSGDYRGEAIQALELQRAQIDERLSRLTDALIDRLIEKDVYEERKAALLHQRAMIDEQRTDLLAHRDAIGTNVANFLELVKSLSDNAKFTNALERRELIKSATSNLGVDQNTVVFSWESPFSVLIARDVCSYGPPERDACRTANTQKTMNDSDVQGSAIDRRHNAIGGDLSILAILARTIFEKLTSRTKGGGFHGPTSSLP